MKRSVYGKKNIAAMVSRLAKQIDAEHTRHFSKKELLLVGVLQGALHFVSDLSRAVKTPHTVGFVFASSYDGQTSKGQVLMEWVSGHLNRDLSGVHVVLVDEICDTGLTLKALSKHIADMHEACPRQVQSCVLLQRQRHDIRSCNYVGAYTVGKEFFIGYGLDDNQALRHLPYIATK